MWKDTRSFGQVLGKASGLPGDTPVTRTIIKKRTVLFNALLNITVDCDCLPGEPQVMASDSGFLGLYHPVSVDAESLERVGANLFTKTRPSAPRQRQFEHADAIGFHGATQKG